MCINNINEYPIIISKLSLKDLTDKYGIKDEDDDIEIPCNPSNLEDKEDTFYLWIDDECQVIAYPYEKAIGQLVVLEVPKMNVQEVTYEELLQIPSKRGTGKLGSSSK